VVLPVQREGAAMTAAASSLDGLTPHRSNARPIFIAVSASAPVERVCTPRDAGSWSEFPTWGSSPLGLGHGARSGKLVDLNEED